MIRQDRAEPATTKLLLGNNRIRPPATRAIRYFAIKG